MKDKIILGLLAGVLLTLGSCKEESFTVYSAAENENNIYFPNQLYDYFDQRIALTAEDGNRYISPLVGSGKFRAAQDTLDHSTATGGTIVVIPVRTMGYITDYKRDFACRALLDTLPGMAKEEDFRILESFINANSRDGGIIVELFTENMNEEDVLTIEFELMPNENFQTNFQNINRRVNSTDYVSTLHITLRYTMVAMQPAYYSTYWAPTIGPWSIKKLQVLTTYLNFDSALLTVMVPDIYTLISYGIALRTWLEEYERDNGRPYYEKDGKTPMEVGTFVKALW